MANVFKLFIATHSIEEEKLHNWSGTKLDTRGTSFDKKSKKRIPYVAVKEDGLYGELLVRDDES